MSSMLDYHTPHLTMPSRVWQGKIKVFSVFNGRKAPWLCG
jgi:hypothetical protein